MSRFRAIADLTDDGLIIRTDWDTMPGAELEAAVDALCGHLGCSPMRKASPHKERIDPRFGELAVLIAGASDSWAKFGKRLAERVLDLITHAQLFPLKLETQRAIRALFDEHRDALQLSLGAPDLSQRRIGELEQAHLLSPVLAAGHGALETAYRLGKAIDPSRIHERPIRAEPPTTREVLAIAREVPLTATDRAAIRWAQEHAGELVTRPVVTSEGRVRLRLQEEQLGGLRAALVHQLERPGDRRANLVHDLQRVLTGDAAQADLTRIAQTELANAYGHGAYERLKEQIRAAGIADPQVYRTASIHACEHCRRIWGPPTKPRIYRLAELETWEASGGNRGIPAADWGPVIGAVHPNCLCGPVALWVPAFGDAVSRAAEEVLRTFGRF